MKETEIKSKEAAQEWVAFLERKSLNLVKQTQGMDYVDLTRAENQLHAWRKSINTIKKLWGI